jgi:hypothetical protein
LLLVVFAFVWAGLFQELLGVVGRAPLLAMLQPFLPHTSLWREGSFVLLAALHNKQRSRQK